MEKTQDNWTPTYSRWRHGGWYVDNVRYPSGAIGCVSRNYEDRKWRIVCHPLPFEEQPTFRTRDEAARAEHELVVEAYRKRLAEFKAKAKKLLYGLFAADDVGRVKMNTDAHTVESFAVCPICSLTMEKTPFGYDFCADGCELRLWDLRHSGPVPEMYIGVAQEG